MEVFMEIKISALKFTANENQISFIQKKVERLSRFIADPDSEVEVTMVLEPDARKVQLKADGNIIERHAATFEDAITGAVDAMKEKLTREKEKALRK